MINFAVSVSSLSSSACQLSHLTIPLIVMTLWHSSRHHIQRWLQPWKKMVLFLTISFRIQKFLSQKPSRTHLIGQHWVTCWLQSSFFSAPRTKFVSKSALSKNYKQLCSKKHVIHLIVPQWASKCYIQVPSTSEYLLQHLEQWSLRKINEGMIKEKNNNHSTAHNFNFNHLNKS